MFSLHWFRHLEVTKLRLLSVHFVWIQIFKSKKVLIFYACIFILKQYICKSILVSPGSLTAQRSRVWWPWCYVACLKLLDGMKLKFFLLSESTKHKIAHASISAFFTTFFLQSCFSLDLSAATVTQHSSPLFLLSSAVHVCLQHQNGTAEANTGKPTKRSEMKNPNDQATEQWAPCLISLTTPEVYSQRIM